jgi:hypothetical protein
MKKFNLYLPYGKSLLAGLLVLAGLNSCTSEYHWVKAKSADPNIFQKETVQYKAPVSNETANAALNEANLKSDVNSALKTPVLAHGQASVNRQILDQKAMEISKSLSPERIAALNSTNTQIRTQAVKETLHEQLLKNASFSKLSLKKQEKIESKMATKISKAGAAGGDQIWGINKLIVYGLALFVIGVIFLFIFWPIGLLIELVGGIIFIIGLIQQFS